MDLVRIASRVAAGSIPFFLVLADEPVGVAVGFRPSEKALAAIRGELDEQWTLVEDDGSYGTPFLADSTQNDVVIRDVELYDGIEEGLTPLGMDLSVWRSEEEMLTELTG